MMPRLKWNNHFHSRLISHCRCRPLRSRLWCTAFSILSSNGMYHSHRCRHPSSIPSLRPYQTTFPSSWSWLNRSAGRLCSSLVWLKSHLVLAISRREPGTAVGSCRRRHQLCLARVPFWMGSSRLGMVLQQLSWVLGRRSCRHHLENEGAEIWCFYPFWIYSWCSDNTICFKTHFLSQFWSPLPLSSKYCRYCLQPKVRPIYFGRSELWAWKRRLICTKTFYSVWSRLFQKPLGVIKMLNPLSSSSLEWFHIWIRDCSSSPQYYVNSIRKYLSCKLSNSTNLVTWTTDHRTRIPG